MSCAIFKGSRKGWQRFVSHRENRGRGYRLKVSRSSARRPAADSVKGTLFGAIHGTTPTQASCFSSAAVGVEIQRQTLVVALYISRQRTDPVTVVYCYHRGTANVADVGDGTDAGLETSFQTLFQCTLPCGRSAGVQGLWWFLYEVCILLPFCHQIDPRACVGNVHRLEPDGLW